MGPLCYVLWQESKCKIIKNGEWNLCAITCLITQIAVYDVREMNSIKLLTLLFVAQVGAQNFDVNGTVLDNSGFPIPGVNVIVKNTKK